MARTLRLSVKMATAVIVHTVAAQPQVEQNYSICSWARLRAGIVRDAIYLDGGLLWWQTAFVDDSTPVVSSDGSASGDMYRLNLSRPFDTSTTNLSALLEPMSKAGGAGNNIAPNYVDGTMFTNDGEFYLYGGLPHLTNASTPQSNDAVLGYEAYQYGPHRDSWSPGFYQGSSGDVSRYITNGAGVSAPSENLGFYFSGMNAADHGMITYEGSSATELSANMVKIDMSTMREEEWSNSSLPNEILPRASAELVWLPFSEKGVLIAIGGVTELEEIYPTGLNQSQQQASQEVSPTLMTSLPIYDIASERWFLQNISSNDAPPQLTQFCSVYAVDEDSSAVNVYIYGGYNGLEASDEPSDDVWVLSVPEFSWAKAYEGRASHGRSGHHCVSPYPDKMFVIGGVHQNQAQCVESGFLQVFNLNNLEFDNIYRPDEGSPYKTPNKLRRRGMTKRQIEWSDPELERIFSSKYPQEKITHYYPYKTQESEGSPGASGGSSSVNTVALAVGVSIGVVILILIVIIIVALRRRRKRRSISSMSSRTRRSRISAWMTGVKSSPDTKSYDGESINSTNPELLRQHSNTSPLVSSEFSEPSTLLSTHSDRHARPPQEMAAVERPAPPFELATPYNNQLHPRTSMAVDYAYNTKEGHTSGSPPLSRSKSLNRSGSTATASQGVPGQSQNPFIAGARTSVDSPHSSSSSSSASAYSTTPWPLPETRPSWSRSLSIASNGNVTTHLLAPTPAVVPAFPQQYRSKSFDATPDRLRPMLPDEDSSDPSTFSAHTSSDPSSVSPIEPVGSMKYDERNATIQRESMLDAVSPISPDAERYYSRRKSANADRMPGDEWWRR